MKTTRFNTLIRTHGIPAYLEAYQVAFRRTLGREVERAAKAGRLLAVIQPVKGAVYAVPGKLNMLPVGWCVFNEPLPPGLGRVTGVGLKSLRQLMGMLAS